MGSAAGKSKAAAQRTPPEGSTAVAQEDDLDEGTQGTHWDHGSTGGSGGGLALNDSGLLYWWGLRTSKPLNPKDKEGTLPRPKISTL